MHNTIIRVREKKCKYEQNHVHRCSRRSIHSHTKHACKVYYRIDYRSAGTLPVYRIETGIVVLYISDLRELRGSGFRYLVAKSPSLPAQLLFHAAHLH